MTLAINNKQWIILTLRIVLLQVIDKIPPAFLDNEKSLCYQIYSLKLDKTDSAMIPNQLR